MKLRTAHAYRSETYEGDNILMYAVIVTGGKQYKVAEGDVLYIEKLGVDADSEVTFDNVLAVSTDKGFKAGKPKKNEKRKMGHRQPYTKVEITKINA